jgi:hypothetical protein
MLFEEFTKVVYEQIKSKVKEPAEVNLSAVYKNNGIKLTAIHISDGIHNISPTIYLEDYYKQFKKGIKIEDILEDILATNDAHQCKEEFDVSAFSDFEKIKHTFAYKLINYDKNRELLTDVPYVAFLDLAIVFYCDVEMEDFGHATILIHNTHLKLWKITKEQLIKIARKNAPRILPYKIESMYDIVQQIMSEELFVKQSKELESPSLYVLTNKRNYFGAAVMLYPEVLTDFAMTCNRNIVILPSSVHEVMLVPVREDENLEEFTNMVKEVNELQVAREEVLSDHIYYFDRKIGEITIP